jgi:hypothetical protein
VSRYDSANYDTVYRKGAALAAGWDYSKYYGTNALVIANDSSINDRIRATAVNVANGGDAAYDLTNNFNFACVP